MIAGILANLIYSAINRLLGREPEEGKSFKERLSELTHSLTKASSEVDEILKEMAQVARDREDAVKKLENDISSMEGKEKELKEKIAALENTPLPVADHFAKLIESGEKKSAKRDYFLFGAGVVVTTTIAIVIQLFAG